MFIKRYREKVPRGTHVRRAARQRRTERRLGADHHRPQRAAPPDGRRRPAASRKCQNARPQSLTRSLRATDTFLQNDNAASLSTFSLPKDELQFCLFCARLSNILTTRPHPFPSPNAIPMACYFAVNCLILQLPLLLAHLHTCSLLASAHHICLFAIPNCAAQRALIAPSSAG